MGRLAKIATMLLSIVATSAFAPAGAAEAAGARAVTLKVYDPHGHGKLLSPRRARQVFRAERGWDSDALLTRTGLGVVATSPLRGSTRLSFEPRDRPVSLGVAWPDDSRGYSYVILDRRGAGFSRPATVVFNHRAAIDAAHDLDAALRARPDYRPSAAFASAIASARAKLARARACDGDRCRGRLGQRALSAVHRANDLLLAEYGPAHPSADPWIGLTVDDPDAYRFWPSLAASLTKPHGWVRIVFDPTFDHGDPRRYAAAVAAADEAGLRILGEPIDSAFANQYTTAGYRARMRRFVQAFPEVDAWEIGNEVNGCWVDSRSAGGTCTGKLLPHRDRIDRKLAAAAALVDRRRPAADIVLTLYWQLGTDRARWSTFEWARDHLGQRLRERIDVVLLSQYVEDAPMGLAFDTVMRTLGAEFPDQRIGLGELGYWSPDTSRAWWAFDRRPRRARRELAAHYYAAALGYPRSVGGGFWWYFPEEMPDDPGLQRAIRSVADRIAAPSR